MRRDSRGHAGWRDGDTTRGCLTGQVMQLIDGKLAIVQFTDDFGNLKTLKRAGAPGVTACDDTTKGRLLYMVTQESHPGI